jgi:4-hydroxy-3-polyprenylbenzoate decarboxylase
MYSDINDFIADLDKRGLLSRIRESVNPDLEIAALTDRVCKLPGGGPGLLFERPTGFDMPVAINLFGSTERMCLALGTPSLDAVAKEIDEMMTPKMPAGMLDAFKMLPMLDRLRDLMPKTVKDAPCQEVVKRDGSLDELPILKTWPEDGGRYITLPLVITKDPETGVRNIGTYRMQVFDGRTTGMHWQRHKGGAQHHRVAERMGKRLEVAVALSPEPVLAYAATAPMPEGLDELLLAGFLSRRRIELVKAVTVDLDVPASAHIVLEGYVEPGERRREGPFGDHTGFYSLAEDFPVFHITCITMRKKPTYLTTVVGIPPQEDVYLGKASERIFLPMIRKTIPEIVDMHFPPEGIFHNIVLISIDKRYPGHARKIMNACWGLGQLMFSKTVIVFDKDVDVQNVSEAAWIAGTHVDPQRDIQFTVGPMDDLENASNLPAYGSKMGIDATRKWPGEGFMREFPTRLKTTDAARRKADELLKSIAKVK